MAVFYLINKILRLIFNTEVVSISSVYEMTVDFVEILKLFTKAPSKESTEYAEAMRQMEKLCSKDPKLAEEIATFINNSLENPIEIEHLSEKESEMLQAMNDMDHVNYIFTDESNKSAG